jgi:hypothetical protein
MNYPTESCGVAKQTRLDQIVGWVEAQRADSHRRGTMGIAELVLTHSTMLRVMLREIEA